MRILEQFLLLALLISQTRLVWAAPDDSAAPAVPGVPTQNAAPDDHDTTLVESHPDQSLKIEAKEAGKKAKMASKRAKKGAAAPRSRPTSTP